MCVHSVVSLVLYSDYTVHPSRGLLEDNHQVLTYRQTHHHGVATGVHSVSKM